jgi:spore coat protein U-like protein
MNTKKSTLRGAALSAAALLIMAPSFHASATTALADLNVSATVPANCALSTAPVSAGGPDVAVTDVSTAVNGAGAVTTVCSKGTNAVITLGCIHSTATPPLPTLLNGPNSVAYSLGQSSGRRAFVWGGGSEFTANANGESRVKSAAKRSPGAEGHSDTVFATLTF